ncbi:Stress responsive A/B Barrel Domain [Sporobacter termitidis DSM 10068]|uniref:Stress responsive A/B Barrel Domain n=1 Tax=Sporobacter termitidis DSM 10068 TaxID=1123282 RepID=A0A1M5Z1K0_9FIRM|nr:Dabb family protein [Sporobacter termitidis]SHI17948.1 Stress responsive A/B Barrel Domain [Sporobacter termitidis DSM 10068]
MIRHVVMFTFKDFAGGRTKTENLDLAEEMFSGMYPIIPEIKNLYVGKDIALSEGAYDLLLLVDIETPEALKRYLEHPYHVKVSNFVGSVRDDRRVIDVEL